MILNPYSWHARWYLFISSQSLPNNLCSYFWRWVGRTLWVVFGSGVLACLVVVGLYAAGVNAFGHWWGAFALLGLLLLTFGFIIGSAYVCFSVSENPPEWTSIVREYCKAKKERYCPTIDWQERKEQP